MAEGPPGRLRTLALPGRGIASPEDCPAQLHGGHHGFHHDGGRPQEVGAAERSRPLAGLVREQRNQRAPRRGHARPAAGVSRRGSPPAMAHPARRAVCRSEAGAGQTLRREYRARHVDPRAGRDALVGRPLQALELRKLVEHPLQLGGLPPAAQPAAPPPAAARALRERQRGTARAPRRTAPPPVDSAGRGRRGLRASPHHRRRSGAAAHSFRPERTAHALHHRHGHLRRPAQERART